MDRGYCTWYVQYCGHLCESVASLLSPSSLTSKVLVVNERLSVCLLNHLRARKDEIHGGRLEKTFYFDALGAHQEPFKNESCVPFPQRHCVASIAASTTPRDG